MKGDGRSRYTVQLLLPEPVPIDAADLYARLCEWRPNVEQLGQRAVFAIPTADLPVLVHVFAAELDTYADQLCDALTSSPAWRWDELKRRCPASIAIAMQAKRPINPASLLLSFMAVLDTVLFSF